MVKVFASAPVRKNDQDITYSMLEFNIDGFRITMHAWAEWVDYAENCIRVCLTWTKDCRLIISARFRGIADDYPWKQLCSAENNPADLGFFQALAHAFQLVV
ncbi:hypothetical protein CYMTET_22724 [Cymbomonas tetramitiformis]|uniref:Uncharacterized protein n=1 Tax=Cymbomonas tetramitiformis TaxID=36881 RepID=A0AAE0L1X3_9CHLO|nr:hypothetical protein CYMTET_22724 [Cymbomonas tetramitiformis]